MKFSLLAVILLSSQVALAKVETICGTLDFSQPIGKSREKYKDFLNHEIRNTKDKFYYEILEGNELAEKFRYDEICITGEVTRIDKGKHLMQRMSGRPDKISVHSFTDAD